MRGNGAVVLGYDTWKGSAQRVATEVNLSAGIDTISFEVFQTDASGFGVFHPLLYRR
ncbi:MAG: hypothetical protein Q9Q40_01415 [Acidobacteriota bacterium]|nr:hypothetical protein [Acidobacteriota bacterium]